MNARAVHFLYVPGILMVLLNISFWLLYFATFDFVFPLESWLKEDVGFVLDLATRLVALQFLYTCH